MNGCLPRGMVPRIPVPEESRCLKILYTAVPGGWSDPLPTVRPEGPGARAGAVDQAFADDAGRASPALLKRPAGWGDSGRFRSLAVAGFGVVDDLALGVFERRGDVLKDRSMCLLG